MKQLYYGGIGLLGVTLMALLWQGPPQGHGSHDSAAQSSSPTPETAATSGEPAQDVAVAPTPPPLPQPTIDPELQTLVTDYVDTLKSLGFDPAIQGVWVESSTGTAAAYQADRPLPAASLTKLATTLLALDRWPADYRFYTRIAATGPVVDGVLQGDLVVLGGGDPFYVWETAIMLGNRLNALGIRQVQGQLVIDNANHIFVMNFERDRATAGELLRQALDSRLWNQEAYGQYQTLPEGTPEPQVEINGGVVLRAVADADKLTLIVAQPSLTLAEVLKQMNMYSNNVMAELLADLLGGAPALTTKTQELTNLPGAEVSFINGSGLGPENQLSARGACRILGTIAQQLEPQGLGLPDVLPIANQDAGTLSWRDLPTGTIAKTGTLWNVSTLAGLVPQVDAPAAALSRDRSLCFAIFNHGENIDLFHAQQEQLVTALKLSLQPDPAPPTPSPTPATP
ncbi:D-alanyl-D-alanine carboxypeptidase [Prochlorothrix hollandica]|uniref:D-alanyl-D-alanine carboxypeptidase n=1 Tax=Prochlorothrix hollandica TaxID=1223 RepID=UPI0003477C04|nr:D-alanyl-D-alanine carboxypeptidase [Prochlorothrix hollandica]